MTGDKPVRILGVGNVLMGDDGLGPYVVRVIEARYELPDGVEAIDAGTPGLDFTPFLADAAAVIVVDTVTGGGAGPGTVRCYDLAELLATPPPARTNPHQPGLREALMAAELTDSTPDRLLVVGVVPATTETGTALSDPVRAAVDPVIEAVVAELQRLGRPPRRRREELQPDIWWE